MNQQTINISFRKMAKISQYGLMKIKMSEIVPIELLQLLNSSNFEVALISEKAF